MQLHRDPPRCCLSVSKRRVPCQPGCHSRICEQSGQALLAGGLVNQVPLKSVKMLVACTWEHTPTLHHELRLVYQRCDLTRTI
jgi:hypothetical protein